MTGYEKALLGIMLGQGAFSALADSKNASMSRDLNDQARRDEVSRLLMQLRQGQIDRGFDARTALADRMPLGQEQQFIGRNNILRAILPGLAGAGPMGSSDPLIRGAMGNVSNPLSGLMEGGQLRPDVANTFSDSAVARSITERRKALAGIDPTFEFGSTEDYGLVNPFANEVEARRKSVQAGQDASYQDILNTLQGMAANRVQPQQQEKKGGGFKGFLGNMLKVAAPFATFIPGVGPAAAMAIGAGAGALGGKLSGSNPVTSAIMGGAGAYGTEALRQGRFNVFNGGKQISDVPLGPHLSDLAGFEFDKTLDALPGFAGLDVAAPRGEMNFVPARSAAASAILPRQGGSRPTGGRPTSGLRAPSPMSPMTSSPRSSGPDTSGMLGHRDGTVPSMSAAPEPSWLERTWLNPVNVVGPALDALDADDGFAGLLYDIGTSPQGAGMIGATAPGAVSAMGRASRMPKPLSNSQIAHLNESDVAKVLERLNDPRLSVTAKQAMLRAVQPQLGAIPGQAAGPPAEVMAKIAQVADPKLRSMLTQAAQRRYTGPQNVQIGNMTNEQLLKMLRGGSMGNNASVLRSILGR